MTELCRLLINPTSICNAHSTLSHLDLQTPRELMHVGSQATYHSSNIHIVPYKQNQLKYMHQSMFSPPDSTLINAIINDFIEGFTFMKNKLVRRYLAKSPATSKGRMKRSHTGTQKTIPKDHEMSRYMPHSHKGQPQTKH